MAMQVRAYGVNDAKEDLTCMNIERRSPRSDDVTIKILYCGVCHSDLHMCRADWGPVKDYPLVPGHEIIGKVIDVGPNVTRFKAGDHVGVGCFVDSCRQCDSCKEDLEQYCEKGNTQTYGHRDRHDGTPTRGGYSEKIITSEHFVLKMPSGLDLAGAAPLLCAGITTWSPLRHWKVGPGSKVAVVGLGGLGHMALKLAKALGADVTLFTRSASKEADARRLGADHIVLSTDSTQMDKVKRHYDVIIDTVPYAHDLNPYTPTLTVNGTLVLVGLIGKLEPALSTGPLISGRKSVAGSLVGGIAETQEMLDFCAEHNITADIEKIPIQDINKAYQRMLKSDVKYRFVIDLASLSESADE